MPHGRLIALLGLAVTLLYGSVAHASVLKELSLADIVAESDHIVVCTVVSVKSDWDADHRNILTTVQVDVDESWKGTVPWGGRITFVQQGGSVGDIEMSVQGMPVFAAGEHSVLFLRGQNRRHVVGMNQGKRPLDFDAKAKRWVVQPAMREGVLRVKQAGAPIPAELSTDTKETLDTFRDKVQKLVRKGP